MSDIKLYKLLKHFRYMLSKQQYRTIKGLIKSGDLVGAYKGMQKCTRLWEEKHGYI